MVMAEFMAARLLASAEEQNLLQCELEATRRSCNSQSHSQPLDGPDCDAAVAAVPVLPAASDAVESCADLDLGLATSAQDLPESAHELATSAQDRADSGLGPAREADLQLKLDKAKDLLKKMSVQSDEKVGTLRSRIAELEGALAAATHQFNELQSQLVDAPPPPPSTPPPPPSTPPLSSEPPPSASSDEAVARLEQEKRALTTKLLKMKDIVGSMKERQEKALAESEAAHLARCETLAGRLREQEEAHESRRLEVLRRDR
jgi:hypothetical protein